MVFRFSLVSAFVLIGNVTAARRRIACAALNAACCSVYRPKHSVEHSNGGGQRGVVQQIELPERSSAPFESAACQEQSAGLDVTEPENSGPLWSFVRRAQLVQPIYSLLIER